MKGTKIVPQAMGMALAMVGVWAFRTYSGIEVPSEVAVAVGTVMAGFVAIVTPSSLEAE